MRTEPIHFDYAPWRHGGWCVRNVRYPDGAIGCVSRNFPDRRWRIVCDDRVDAPSFRTRDAAARAEFHLAAQARAAADAERARHTREALDGLADRNAPSGFVGV